MNKFPLATAIIFSLGAPLISNAADTTWISTSNPNWFTPGNWSSGAPAGGIGTIFQDGSVTRSIDLGAGLGSDSGMVFNLVAGGGGFTFYSSLTPLGIRNQTGGTYVGILNNDDNVQTYNVPVIMANVSSGGGNSASQTFNAAAGGLTFSGAYVGTASTLNNNGGRLTVDGAFDTTIGLSTGRGDVVGTGGITKNGNGTLTLGGTNANTYSGGTIINAGTILAAKANALGNSSGTLQLSGGTFNTGGKNQAIGTLNLTSSATLDLGTGASAVTFANSSAIAWGEGTFHILNWTTNVDSIRFGTTSAGLTSTQLSQIVFDDVPGFWGTIIDNSGFIVPVPEPSTIALSLLGGFGLAIAIRRRKS
jgi:autotransporter-associated beta strand protein